MCMCVYMYVYVYIYIYNTRRGEISAPPSPKDLKSLDSYDFY